MASKEELKYKSGLHTHYETEGTSDDKLKNPENPENFEWICYGSFDACDTTTYGKWMVFKHFDELNNAWRKIIHAMQEGTLEGCINIMTSTKVYRPGSYGPGPCTSGVVEVYTSKEYKEVVGKCFCLLVKHDVEFKTEKATKDGIPARESTMYYNGGDSYMKDGHDWWANLGYSKERVDIWHLNVVTSTDYPELQIKRPYGKWVIRITKKEATGVWHILRRKIESDKCGVLEMECPPCCSEDPFVININTTEEDWESVGEYLLDLMERNIIYEFQDERKRAFELEWK